MNVKPALALFLLAATGTGTGTKLTDSVVTYKQAMGACPGALGSVTFAMGHARVAAQQGVTSSESAADANGNMTVVFKDTNGSKAAHFAIDQPKRLVSAKNMHVAMHGQVACILPD
jgi:hypothetical protein